jgi:amidase
MWHGRWRRFYSYAPSTPLQNTSGQPAINLPLHWNAAGLPIGIQFVGRFGDEATLLGLAAELERARPWDSRRPNLSVSIPPANCVPPFMVTSGGAQS